MPIAAVWSVRAPSLSTYAYAVNLRICCQPTVEPEYAHCCGLVRARSEPVDLRIRCQLTHTLSTYAYAVDLMMDLSTPIAAVWSVRAPSLSTYAHVFCILGEKIVDVCSIF